MAGDGFFPATDTFDLLAAPELNPQIQCTGLSGAHAKDQSRPHQRLGQDWYR